MAIAALVVEELRFLAMLEQGVAARVVKRQAQAERQAMLYLAKRLQACLRGEQIHAADLVIGAEVPPI
ncbi:hypothetical protein D3C87_2140550 [compost metagenome]